MAGNERIEKPSISFNEALGVYESAREAMNGVEGYFARLEMYCEQRGEDISAYHDPSLIAQIEAEIAHDWKKLTPDDLDAARVARTKYHGYKRDLKAVLDV